MTSYKGASCFSKDDSLAIKGIAILMMLLHHNFWKTELYEKYIIDFRPFTEQAVVDLALSFKICVSLFVFITGYGLTLSIKKNSSMTTSQNSKWLVTRLISTLSGYWFVAILAYVITQLINGRTVEVFFNNGILEGIVKMLINFMGLSNLVGLSTFNGTWWYMSAAVVFIFLVPIFYGFAKKYSHLSLIFIVIVIPYILDIGYPGGTDILSFVLPLVLGITFAEYNLLGYLKDLKLYKASPVINKILKLIVGTIILLVVYRLYMELPTDKFWAIKWGFIPVFVIYYCYEFIIRLPGIRRILIHLGRHSMNIFLVHTFIRFYYLSDLTYGFKHFILITLFLLVSSLMLSYCIEGLKKLIKYDKWMSKLIRFINNKIDILDKAKQESIIEVN